MDESSKHFLLGGWCWSKYSSLHLKAHKARVLFLNHLLGSLGRLHSISQCKVHPDQQIRVSECGVLRSLTTFKVAQACLLSGSFAYIFWFLSSSFTSYLLIYFRQDLTIAAQAGPMLVVYSKLTSKLVAAVCFSQFLISSLTCARLDRVFARGNFH